MNAETLRWRKIRTNDETEGYLLLAAIGHWRITRHEIDDRWDIGALVPYAVQWTLEESAADGSWRPVDLYDRLLDAKHAAARAEQRRAAARIETEDYS